MAYSVPKEMAASSEREVRKGILQQGILPENSFLSALLTSEEQWGVAGVSC